MKCNCVSVSDIGITRKINQDSTCLRVTPVKGYGDIVLAVICDGVGGLQMGELASYAAVKEFSSWYDNKLPSMAKTLSWEIIGIEWSQLIDEINFKLYRYGVDNDAKLGTTLSALLIADNRYIAAQVGDSRVYAITDSVSRITEDHSFISRELRLGRMTEAEIRSDRRRNALTRCIGTQKSIKADIYTGSVNEKTTFLVCSDGLWKKLPDDQLLKFLSNDRKSIDKDIELIGYEMIEYVKDNDEKDNISAIIISCDDTDGSRIGEG